MRFLFFIILSLHIPIFSSGQTQVNLFYNDDWQITEKAQATYFRNCIVSVENYWHFIGPVRDFYANGRIKMTGNYNADGDKTGEFIFYYENGNIERKGLFNDNLQNGLWEYWYANGNKKQEILFDSAIVSIKNYWDEVSNHLVVNGEGIYTEYFEDQNKGFYKITGPVKNGRRHDKWKCYHTKSTGEITRTFYEETFENGNFKNGIIHSIAMGKTKSDKEYDNKNKPPYQLAYTENFYFDYKLFGVGNQKAMIDYVFNKIEPTYSAKRIKNADNLKAILSILHHHIALPQKEFKLQTKMEATIKADGTLSNFLFPKNVEEEIKTKIILVLNRITDLKPEKSSGKPVDSKIEIPLEFNIVFKYLDIKKVKSTR